MLNVPRVLEGRVRATGYNNKTDNIWYSVQRPAVAPCTSVVFFGGDYCVDIAQSGSKDDRDILRLGDAAHLLDLLRRKFSEHMAGAVGSYENRDGSKTYPLFRQRAEGGVEQQTSETGGEGSGGGGGAGGLNVFVVEPTRVDQGIWACYDNFLEGTKSGEPARGYVKDGIATRHLVLLLAFVLSHVSTLLGEAATPVEAACNPPHPHLGAPNSALSDEFVRAAVGFGDVVLVGFSKGGVLLNQLLAELPEQPHAFSLKALHYADAGLNGRGAYLTHPEMLHQVGALRGSTSERPLAIYLHGTPRQWLDRRRSWIADEKNRMVALAREAGLQVFEKMYFADHIEPSLAMHFRCLEAFET